MKGDDLHALGIGFQTHFLRLGVAAAGLQLVLQVVQQSLGALQMLAGVLQQLAQMQQIGQAALTLGHGQQARRNMLLVHPAVEHGQHALFLPLRQPTLARLGQRICVAEVLQHNRQLRI